MGGAGNPFYVLYRYVRPVVLVANKVSILAILVGNRVELLHSGLEISMFFTQSYSFIIINNTTD